MTTVLPVQPFLPVLPLPLFRPFLPFLPFLPTAAAMITAAADAAIMARCHAGYKYTQQFRTTMEMWWAVEFYRDVLGMVPVFITGGLR